jgi:nicotinate-nucleotide pyrophosphorylase (carboxylating)
MMVFDLPAVRTLIEAALAEDIGRGDLTTQLTVPPALWATATIVAKQDGVLAGAPLVDRIFAALTAREVAIKHHVDDGAQFAAGAMLASFEGPAADLLVGERVTLNFVQQLSGIATLTRHFVDAVRGTKAQVIDTRKTTPGMRVLEKYAVRMGGGRNHRFGLDDGILIKDNHITAAGGVGPAVAAARRGAPHTMTVQVECAALAQIDEALAAGADAILLDNLSVDQLAAAVRQIAGRVPIEASGGVSLGTIRAIAETGVDLISVGALTHSALAVDLSMKIHHRDTKTPSGPV